jgi:hypothetical protein
MARGRAELAAGGRGTRLAAVGRTTITRRRALALGAAAGLGSLLSARPSPAFGRSAPGRATGFGLDVGAADFAGRTSRVLRAPRRFDLLGVRGARAAGLEVRVRRAGGRWSDWVPLAVHGDHAPDTGTGERASDPVWAGGCDELQLRARRRPAGALRVHFVAVPAAKRRGRPVARAAAKPARAAPGTPPAIIPRASWGADAVPPRSAPGFGAVLLAFVHHTVTANDYTPQQSAGMVLAIAKYHRDTNGWNDIGYNFLVDQYGQVFEGRAGGVEQAVIGAQAQGYNSQSTGLAVLGTFSDVGLPEPAKAAIAQLLGWKLSLHGVPCEGQVVITSGGGPLNRYGNGTPVTLQRISGHRDGDATDCPGNAAYAQLPELRQRAAGLAGPVVVTDGRVTLNPTDPAIEYGNDAVFAGAVVRPDSTAGAGEVVALQKRGAKRAWVTVARTTAGADGGWQVRLPWRRGGAVRAHAAGISSKVATVGVTPRLQVRRAAKRVAAGANVGLSGRVRPATPVAVVLERQGSDGAFHRVRAVRGRIRKTSWRADVRLRRPGLYRLTPRTATGKSDVRAAPLYVRAVRRTGGLAAR